MAEGKKSFIAYSDWRDTFDELPDEDAGKLIKHIFAYVNDENPKSDSVLIKAVFANIKSTLKRDLKKWDKQLKQRSEAGKKSAEIRSTKSNERSTVVDETVRNSTDSVNVSVNDTVNKEESVSPPPPKPNSQTRKKGDELVKELSSEEKKSMFRQLKSKFTDSTKEHIVQLIDGYIGKFDAKFPEGNDRKTFVIHWTYFVGDMKYLPKIDPNFSRTSYVPKTIMPSE